MRIYKFVMRTGQQYSPWAKQLASCTGRGLSSAGSALWKERCRKRKCIRS